MKALVVLGALMLVAPALALAQASKDEEQIRQRLHAWDEAYKERDVSVLGPMLADGFKLTDASGAVLTKAQYLMSIVKTPDFSRIINFASEDVVVQLEGDKATVTGKSAVKGRPRGRGQVLPGTYRFTDRWIKQQGVWKAAETRATRVGG